MRGGGGEEVGERGEGVGVRGEGVGERGEGVILEQKNMMTSNPFYCDISCLAGLLIACLHALTHAQKMS